jgi:hypothetical protein
MDNPRGILLRYTINKQGEYVPVNQWHKYHVNELTEIDPVQIIVDASYNFVFEPLLRAAQIMENRLRIEYAMHHKKLCGERCDILYDLKALEDAVNSIKSAS